ncbi:MAG: TonB family protein [Cyanobacteria bacterium J06626_18]
MGFSKPCAEQRKKEIRLFRRIIIGAIIGAVGLHISSVPLIVRFAANLIGTFDPLLEKAQEPVDVIWVEEEDVPPEPPEEVAPPPTNEEAVANEPAAAASEAALPPLPTTETAVPTPATADSVDTVPTQAAAVTSESGIPEGQGAVGESDTIGIVAGSGSPEVAEGPVLPPNVAVKPPDVALTPPTVPAIASLDDAQRRRGGSRVISCNPCTLPDYPESQLRRGREGLPTVAIEFNGDGSIASAEIESSSGNSAFDEATLQEIRDNWRLEDPRGVGGWVVANIAFVIEGSEQYEAVQAVGTQESVELPVQPNLTSTDSAQPARVAGASGSVASVASDPTPKPATSEALPSSTSSTATRSSISSVTSSTPATPSSSSSSSGSSQPARVAGASGSAAASLAAIQQGTKPASAETTAGSAPANRETSADSKPVAASETPTTATAAASRPSSGQSSTAADSPKVTPPVTVPIPSSAPAPSPEPAVSSTKPTVSRIAPGAALRTPVPQASPED